jgi:hypothetical protein
MQTTLHHIEYADTVHAERSDTRHGRSTQERNPTLRTRVGNRLIGLGERLANGRTATATR